MINKLFPMIWPIWNNLIFRFFKDSAPEIKTDHICAYMRKVLNWISEKQIYQGI